MSFVLSVEEVETMLTVTSKFAYLAKLGRLPVIKRFIDPDRKFNHALELREQLEIAKVCSVPLKVDKEDILALIWIVEAGLASFGSLDVMLSHRSEITQTLKSIQRRLEQRYPRYFD
jgi:hypothetical protein